MSLPALFTKGEAYWYFLLHNGLLLPAQVGLVCLSALAREPNSEWLRHWSPRLGAASLSIFALHVPLFNLFRTLEQLVRGNPMACFNDWDQCITAAGQVQLSMTGYVIFLLSTVTLCVLLGTDRVPRKDVPDLAFPEQQQCIPHAAHRIASSIAHALWPETGCAREHHLRTTHPLSASQKCDNRRVIAVNHQ